MQSLCMPLATLRLGYWRQTARNEKTDLIVMGSEGLTGMAKLNALGSIARKVTELSRCPVLIAR
jgi:nucleotide-binding universal stress UspA family protein